ncbi:MAG: GDP-mannose 4,6-dehydratase [Candidatus Micrarchaeota archaeon]
MFWKEKRVLVTGATGFAGSWLAEDLVKQGAIVTVTARKNSPRLDSIKHLRDKIKISWGDLTLPETGREAVKDQDVVFDLAANTQVPHAREHPIEAMDNNVKLAENTVEALRKFNDSAFLVYSSTDKVYGEPKFLPITEEHPIIGKSPYDASKIAAERFAYSYHATYGMKIAISRCCNIYGGRDANLLRVVPDFALALNEGKPPVIRGSGLHERDFIFVDDAVAGFMLIAEKQSASNGEVFNLGNNAPISIRKLAEEMVRISGKKVNPVILGKQTPGEIDVQYLAFEKARKTLGWHPAVPLEEGLKKSLEWYSQNAGWWKEVCRKTSEFYGF